MWQSVKFVHYVSRRFWDDAPVAEGDAKGHPRLLGGRTWVTLLLSCEMLAYSSTDAIEMLWLLLGLISSWPTPVEILPTRMAHLFQRHIEGIFRKSELDI